MSWLYKKVKKQHKTTYYILGFKFTFKRRAEKKILIDIEDFIRRSTSPAQIPQAQGLLRDIQLSALRILLEVDRVCKENDITYWIDFGTLLGAVRHKDFIPWDDDIDICMMRDDYEKFEKIFDKATHDKNLFVELRCHKNGRSNIIKVHHKKFPNIFVDIFPYDFYTSKLNTKGKIELHNKLTKIKADYAKKAPKNKQKQLEFRKRFLAIRDKHIYQNQKPNAKDKPALFWGIDYYHQCPRSVFDYETFFPLSEVEFCGHKFPAPANPDIYLTYVYKDYMALPSSLHYHFDLTQISIDEAIALKKYAKGEL